MQKSVDFAHLKIPKLMAKCGPKTLCISTRRGNMRMMMIYMFIIRMQKSASPRRSHHSIALRR